MTPPLGWLMADHTSPDGDREAEPVLVEQDGPRVSLVLDDGSRLSMDRAELRAALDTGVLARAA